ncbi:MAG: hypothetical protein HYT79_00665 [Elusimicrobia bacterium]|nr:hypothetical protein [Elusimicrobiota bacterium]
MAGIESESGVIATYMVMINSPLYDIKSRQSRGTLKLLLCGGHEIGLHFDFDGAHRLEAPSMDATEQKIDSACQRLEDILGASVKSVSFHRPLERFLRGPSTVAGRVNAYSKELMDWYLSDSRGNWREGEPLPKLNNPEKKLLQLLIHPIWWSDHHVAPEDRLEEFFEKSIKGLKPEAAKVFDAALASHLTIQRRGYANVELAKPAA